MKTKTFYVINRDDIRQIAKIAEIDLPDLLLQILDDNYWLSENESTDLTFEVLSAPTIKELYWMLDYFRFDMLETKAELLQYIDENR